MKRIIAFVLVFVCVAVYAVADTLSDLSFDELIALRGELNKEIMSRPEWKEVEVPAGTWTVGRDIPAGAYCVKIAGNGMVNVSVWKKAPKDYSNNGLVYNELISEGSPYGRMELQEGWIVEIGFPVIFTPPISLGF